MSEKIFIDGSYPSSTTIVATDAKNKLEEVLMDSSLSKSIRSNIYLGTIIRVEHSLQAAFVDYGGEKNGFLPFSDIHPDYYQLPSSDKEEIQKEIKKHQLVDDKEDDEISEDKEEEYDVDNERVPSIFDIYKKYNIQEVIKRGQNILVQVYKDERGTKGASLTSYITLPGKYCVFMPNTFVKIGISHKIINPTERRRIRSIVKKFPMANGMSLVVRTAANGATEEDLYKDYEYLIKLWNKIRNITLQSKTMSLIYSESGIIKQAIRDIYNKNTQLILVEGKEVYQEVLEAVSEFAPDELNKISLHSEESSLFTKYGIEKQLKELLYERVDLQSGGYIIIQPTEALVSIDVNSGKSTAERNIEDMALKINMEAANEIARQLKLRDLGGLIVIDFIDMMDIRNRKTVERSLKALFYNDRAKVQMSRISIFGLLELSRQRIRSSINDTSTIACETCGGGGKIRTAEVVINYLLKELKQIKNINKKIEVFCSKQTSLSIKNSRLSDIKNLENNYKISISISEDSQMIVDQYRIVAKNTDGSIETISDYKGTPLSIYFYEKEKEAEYLKDSFRVSFKEEEQKPAYRSSDKTEPRNNYRGNKPRFNKPEDSKEGRPLTRPENPNYKGKKHYNKNYRVDRNKPIEKKGVINMLFTKLFGKK